MRDNRLFLFPNPAQDPAPIDECVANISLRVGIIGHVRMLSPKIKQGPCRYTKPKTGRRMLQPLHARPRSLYARHGIAKVYDAAGCFIFQVPGTCVNLPLSLYSSHSLLRRAFAMALCTRFLFVYYVALQVVRVGAAPYSYSMFIWRVLSRVVRLPYMSRHHPSKSCCRLFPSADSTPSRTVLSE